MIGVLSQILAFGVRQGGDFGRGEGNLEKSAVAETGATGIYRTCNTGDNAM